MQESMQNDHKPGFEIQELNSAKKQLLYLKET